MNKAGGLRHESPGEIVSITFALSATVSDWDGATYVIDCDCPAATPLVFPSSRLAWVWADRRNITPVPLRSLPNGCVSDTCREYALRPQPVASWRDASVNVSSTNGRELLDLLGVPDESTFGSGYLGAQCVSAQDLLGRVLLALALIPADLEIVGAVSGNLIYCGRPASYLHRRLTELHDLASTAAHLQREVVRS